MKRQLTSNKKFIFVLTLLLILMTLTSSNVETTNNQRLASWYGGKFQGRLTASGERFDTAKNTAASNVHSLGTYLMITRVIDSETLKVKVKVNDRINPRYADRIDLSKGAMKKLKGIEDGVININIEEINLL